MTVMSTSGVLNTGESRLEITDIAVTLPRAQAHARLVPDTSANTLIARTVPFAWACCAVFVHWHHH